MHSILLKILYIKDWITHICYSHLTLIKLNKMAQEVRGTH